MKQTSIATKIIALVVAFAFTFTSTIAYSDASSVLSAFKQDASHLKHVPLVNSGWLEDSSIQELLGRNFRNDELQTVLSFQEALERQQAKSPRQLIRQYQDEKERLRPTGTESFAVHRAELRDDTAKAILGIIVLAVLSVVVGLLVYDVYLFFHIVGLFRSEPFSYGWIGAIFGSFVVTGIIGGFLGKTLTFFKGSSDDKDKKEKKEKMSEGQAAVAYFVIFGAIALVSLPFILHANWGTISESVSSAMAYFTQWKLHYLLGGLLGLSVLIHVIQKLVGKDGEKSFGFRLFGAFLAMFIAPVAEEVIYRWVFFNFSKWLWVSFFGFTEALSFKLPLFGVSVGWGLPLGIFIAIAGNADSFFKAHGREKWFHHWLLGAVMSYAYYQTGTLMVPIAIHFIWNTIASIVDLVLNTTLPLNGIVLTTPNRKHVGKEITPKMLVTATPSTTGVENIKAEEPESAAEEVASEVVTSDHSSGRDGARAVKVALKSQSTAGSRSELRNGIEALYQQFETAMADLKIPENHREAIRLWREIKKATSETYNRNPEFFAGLRSEFEPHVLSALEFLVVQLRKHAEARAFLERDGKLHVLERGPVVRDLRWFSQHGDLDVVAIDNANQSVAFIQREFIDKELGVDSNIRLVLQDMESELEPGQIGAFQAVRDWASLHHLPIIRSWESGIEEEAGADLAVKRAFQALQPGGVYIGSVKAGNGIVLRDTKHPDGRSEGLGFRFYQLYSYPTLSNLLRRHKFRRIQLETETNDRGEEEIVFAAEKPTTTIDKHDFVGLWRESFAPIPGKVQLIDEAHSEAIFRLLQANGYLDENGKPTEKFAPYMEGDDVYDAIQKLRDDHADIGLGLDDKYSLFTIEIAERLRIAVEVSRSELRILPPHISDAKSWDDFRRDLNQTGRFQGIITSNGEPLGRPLFNIVAQVVGDHLLTVESPLGAGFDAALEFPRSIQATIRRWEDKALEDNTILSKRPLDLGNVTVDRGGSEMLERIVQEFEATGNIERALDEAVSRSELRHFPIDTFPTNVLPTGTKDRIRKVMSMAVYASNTAPRSELRRMVNNALGIETATKVNGLIGLEISNLAVYDPDNPDFMASTLPIIAEVVDNPIAIIAPDGIGREVVLGVNEHLPADRQFILAKDWNQARSELRRRGATHIRAIIADSERGTESLLLNRYRVDEVKVVKPGSIQSLFTAAGLSYSLVESFRSELRLAYSA